jgi:protein TonB
MQKRKNHVSNRPLAAPSVQQVRSIVPLCMIILAHVGVFYALQSGLIRQPGQANQSEPKEIFASLISANSPPEPMLQKQLHAPEAATRRIEPPTPVKPIPQHQAPSEHAITTPPVAPQPVLQPQPAASVATTASTASPSMPSTPAAPTQPKTLTSGVEYLQAPQPDYPPISRRMSEEGRVILRVLVNDKGRTENVEVQTSSGSTRLDESARQALKHALFKPHSEDGRAVAVYAIVPITFKLNK